MKKVKNGSESTCKNSPEVKTNYSILTQATEILRRLEGLSPRHVHILKRLVEHFSIDELNHSDFYGEEQLWEIVGMTEDSTPIEDYLWDLQSQKLLRYCGLEGEEDEPDVIYGFYIEDLQNYSEILRNFPLTLESQKLKQVS